MTLAQKRYSQTPNGFYGNATFPRPKQDGMNSAS